MRRICIIQPILTNYTLPVFLEMAHDCAVDLVFSTAKADLAFGNITRPVVAGVRYFEVPTFKPFGEKLGLLQGGVIGYLVRERPDAVLVFANPRYLSFWLVLISGRILGIPIHAHGHGIFKKRRVGRLYRLMMHALLKLVTRYICYAPVVWQSFTDHGFSAQKLSVAHNSVINPCPVRPEEKTGEEKGVLFVGRLRAGSNVLCLVQVIERLRQADGLPITLHVIGTGEELTQLQQQAAVRSWLILHGLVYEPERIREISRACYLGCYPGNAGLSVVHMLSLSLPVVVHSDLPSHQGPEPSFVRDGISGVLFDRVNAEESLYEAIKGLSLERGRLARMQRAAFQEYTALVTPPLSTRFLLIMGNGSEKRLGRMGQPSLL